MQNPESSSKESRQGDILQKISEQLNIISNDQKRIGKFIGENTHSIRIMLLLLVILTIINILVTLFF